MSHIDHAKLNDHVRESDTETREGERDYVEHVSSQRLSTGERLVVIIAAALMVGVATFGYMGESAKASVRAPAAGDSHKRYSQHECDKYTPYGYREC